MQAIDVTGLTEEDIRLLETRPSTLSIDPATGIGTPASAQPRKLSHNPAVRTERRKTRKSADKMNRNVQKFGNKIYDRSDVFQPKHLPAKEYLHRLSRKVGEKRVDWMEQVGADHIMTNIVPKIHNCGLQRETRLPILKELIKFVRDGEKQTRQLRAFLKPKKAVAKRRSEHKTKPHKKHGPPENTAL